jgi:hypothetical protein
MIIWTKLLSIVQGSCYKLFPADKIVIYNRLNDIFSLFNEILSKCYTDTVTPCTTLSVE